MADRSEHVDGALAVPDDDRPWTPDLLRDPDLDNPLIAAARYRALLAELDQARSEAASRLLAGQEKRAAIAHMHRESAEAIRSRVEEVWRSVAGPLAHHGISDLDQLRPSRTGEDDDHGRDRGGSAVALPGGARGRRGMHAQRRRSHGATGTALDRRAGGGRSGGDPAVDMDDVPFDPAQAPARAHELCLTAMGHAAELRAVSRAGSTASLTIVMGLGCLLVAGAVTALRVFLGVAAIPALAGAAVVAAACVALLTDAGRMEVARATLLGVGAAGAAALATVRVVALDIPGMIGSLVALILAVRFGLGIGAHKDPRRK